MVSPGCAVLLLASGQFWVGSLAVLLIWTQARVSLLPVDELQGLQSGLLPGMLESYWQGWKHWLLVAGMLLLYWHGLKQLLLLAERLLLYGQGATHCGEFCGILLLPAMGQGATHWLLLAAIDLLYWHGLIHWLLLDKMLLL